MGRKLRYNFFTAMESLMSILLKHFAAVFFVVTILVFMFPSVPSRAEDKDLPESVSAQFDTSLSRVGQGTYRKLGFRIYDASLWALQSTWEPEEPYALQLCYARELSKETLVDTVIDNIAEQDVADDATLARWKEELNASLRDVKEGDVLTGVAVPGKKSSLFYNGVNIASIDKAFSDAFFGIWLGDHADEDLRAKLLGDSKRYDLSSVN